MPVARAALLTLAIYGCLVSHAATQLSCGPSDIAFELWTGYVYSAPADLLDTRPGTLLLDECIQLCSSDTACQGLNYETGLCVLFSSSAERFPGAITRSEYPVYTLYLQKVCLNSVQTVCTRPWAFERVQGHHLKQYPRRRLRVGSRLACMQLCLHELEFPCRSVSFAAATGECVLSEVDRFTLRRGERLEADDNYEYFESNCVNDPVRMCEFEPKRGRILKTVDVVFQDVETKDDCQRLCLGANFRCHTYDFGDTGERVCRLSHHGEASLSHIREPYLEIPDATSYERQSCYNVTLQCNGADMIATIQTSRIFNGKIYARSSPNSCVLDVEGQMAVNFRMGYQDLNCDVHQDSPGVFTSDIIIQHHDQIVTSSDLGLSLRCLYSLGNRTVSHTTGLNVNGQLGTTAHESAVVRSPNVSMSITDRQGADIVTAQVGDSLALLFRILDLDSPYEILVRELIAQDGVDSAEILLIDERGCPTDPSIMGAVAQVRGSGQLLTVPFDAFKFPSSDVVQFKALVTPCLPRCRPVTCEIRDFQGGYSRVVSHGRRRRALPANESQSDVLVVRKIRIADTFEFRAPPPGEEGVGVGPAVGVGEGGSTDWRRPETSMNLTGVALAAACFLVAQVCIMVGWVYLRRRSGAGQRKVEYYVNSSAAQNDAADTARSSR